jgi:hypothetical protein
MTGIPPGPTGPSRLASNEAGIGVPPKPSVTGGNADDSVAPRRRGWRPGPPGAGQTFGAFAGSVLFPQRDGCRDDAARIEPPVDVLQFQNVPHEPRARQQDQRERELATVSACRNVRANAAGRRRGRGANGAVQVAPHVLEGASPNTSPVTRLVAAANNSDAMVHAGFERLRDADCARCRDEPQSRRTRPARPRPSRAPRQGALDRERARRAGAVAAPERAAGRDLTPRFGAATAEISQR